MTTTTHIVELRFKAEELRKRKETEQTTPSYTIRDDDEQPLGHTTSLFLANEIAGALGGHFTVDDNEMQEAA